MFITITHQEIKVYSMYENILDFNGPVNDCCSKFEVFYYKIRPLRNSGLGAAGQIRTADLILTKDALYLLSYSSKYSPANFAARGDGDREET
jgi:hypothetical protein